MNQNSKVLIEMLSTLPDNTFTNSTRMLLNLIGFVMPEYNLGTSKTAYAIKVVKHLQSADLAPLKEERVRLITELSKDSMSEEEKAKIYFQALTIDIAIGAQANNPKPKSKPDEK